MMSDYGRAGSQHFVTLSVCRVLCVAADSGCSAEAGILHNFQSFFLSLNHGNPLERRRQCLQPHWILNNTTCHCRADSDDRLLTETSSWLVLIATSTKQKRLDSYTSIKCQVITWCITLQRRVHCEALCNILTQVYVVPWFLQNIQLVQCAHSFSFLELQGRQCWVWTQLHQLKTRVGIGKPNDVTVHTKEESVGALNLT